MEMFYSTHYRSPVGNIVLASTENSIVGLWIEGQKYFGATVPENFTDNGNLPVLVAGRKWLDDYFAGKRPPIARLPLAPIGGEFRQTVWRLLMEIPYGETTTYGKLAGKTAKLLGRAAMSAQAVGGAVGHNQISIIIPCHRVIGANGSLTGYAGGIATKVQLLKLEGADMTAMFIPKQGTAL